MPRAAAPPQKQLCRLPSAWASCAPQEASYICKGSEGSGAVMRMSSSAQDALWQVRMELRPCVLPCCPGMCVPCLVALFVVTVQPAARHAV
jgi:hypothetical protein